MTTKVKNLLTALATVGLFGSGMVAAATSVREYEAMALDEKTRFLVKETYDLLAKVKAYDPQLEQKTRFYMLEETNQIGGSMGLGAVMDVINLSETKRPETMDKVQVETITKVIMQNFWKKQGIVVPDTVLQLKKSPSPSKLENSDAGATATNSTAQP